MAIPEKPTLTTPPAAPIRGQDPTVFANRANAYVIFIVTNVTDLTAAIDWQNTVFTATETEATNAAQSVVDAAAEVVLAADQVTLAEGQVTLAEGQVILASDQVTLATEQKDLAETAATIAEATANFVGPWASLSGSLNVPAVVLHAGSYWQLLVNLADVTASEPGVSGDWALTVLGPNWQAISTSITLAANAYYAVDFGSSALTLTLPASPSANDFMQLYKSAGVSEGAIIARNGETIMGLAENLNINVEITALYLVYNGTDWRIVR